MRRQDGLLLSGRLGMSLQATFRGEKSMYAAFLLAWTGDWVGKMHEQHVGMNITALRMIHV